MHPGNIAVHNDKSLFFDWADGGVAHPFFDPLPILLAMRRLPDAAAARARLLGVYLDVWTDHEPRPRLQQAGTLVQPLGALHQAISFQHILAGLEA